MITQLGAFRGQPPYPEPVDLQALVPDTNVIRHRTYSASI